MIKLILTRLQELHAQRTLSWRALSQYVPYSTLMRWKARAKAQKPLLQKPGPKKAQPLDWEQLYALVSRLPHGRCRTQGTTQLYALFAHCISRRQLRQMAAQIRQQKLDAMKRIQWHVPGLAWSIDATEYHSSTCKLIPIQDLASKYRFSPLVAPSEDGRAIAQHLEALFRQHGPPLFLKRDNGSPFNSEPVEQLLARYGVLPLNSPPHYPRYNGSMEKSIRDLKTALDKRQHPIPAIALKRRSELEATIHELNHQNRRVLKGLTACHCFHDPKRRLNLSQRSRTKILRLLHQQYWRTIANMARPTHRRLAAAWRHTVESWLRRQGLISISQKQQPNVSTNFPKNWSHN